MNELAGENIKKYLGKEIALYEEGEFDTIEVIRVKVVGGYTDLPEIVAEIIWENSDICYAMGWRSDYVTLFLNRIPSDEKYYVTILHPDKIVKTENGLTYTYQDEDELE